MAFNRHSHLFLSILVFYYKLHHSATAEESIVYSCCPLQNNFNGEYCTAMQPSTEFFMFHQGRWLVPAKFRQNQPEFQLAIEPRNVTSGRCKSNLNITYPSTSVNEIITQTQTSKSGENATSEIFPKFFSNGTMIYKNKLYYTMEYCFDSLSQDGNTIFDIAVTEGGCVEQVYEISTGIRQPYRKKWINQLFAAVAGLSFLFTLFNVIIYISLRNYLNVSGWVEFAYFVALGVFSVLSIPAFLYEPTSDDDTFCYVLSTVLQFAEIMMNSSFIMIAFDVYWMLRKSDTFGSYGEEMEEPKFRLIFYYLFLLAVPIGVTTYGIILNLEYTPEELTLASVANYGEKSCFAPSWFLSEYLLFGLGSGTLLTILLSVNHIFARLSASADVEDAPRWGSESWITTFLIINADVVSLLSNMFFFTLTYWVVDLLKFARPLLQDKRSQEDTSNETFWILLESFTYAQGMLAFTVFIFNRKTLKAFRKKAGTDGTLKEIFRHACCSDGSRVDSAEDATPMSPLMKSSSMRRSTVRQNHHY